MRARVSGWRFTLSSLAVLGSLAAGCTSDEWPPFAPAGASDTAADDALDFVRLDVIEPQATSIYPIDGPIALQARLADPDGLTVAADDTDVVWLSDQADPSDPLLLEGLSGDVSLPPGVYDIGAVARLPNGDRLETTIAGVRVQARWTGVYVGDLDLVVELDVAGFSLAPRCQGPFDMRVSLDGRDVEVEPGTCALDILGQVLQGSYEIDIRVFDAGLVRGTVDFAFDSPFGPLEFPIEWAGAFYDNRFSGGLDAEIELPIPGGGQGLASGSLRARLIDPYVDPEQG